MKKVVKLTEAGSETEAAMLCGYLASCGIEATFDKGTIMGSPFGSGAYSGPHVGRQEIVVHEEDFEAAQDAHARAGQDEPTTS